MLNRVIFGTQIKAPQDAWQLIKKIRKGHQPTTAALRNKNGRLKSMENKKAIMAEFLADSV